MTGFGTFDESSPKRTLVSVTLADELPADERSWLDTCAERYAHDFDGAQITQDALHTPGTKWRVSYDESLSHTPLATFAFRYLHRKDLSGIRSPNDLLTYLNAVRRRFIEGTIEDELHAAPIGAHEGSTFDVASRGGGVYVARLTMPEEVRQIMGEAAAFHRQTGAIVSGHGGIDVRAELRYGPLVLENLLYPSQR